jgi:hypothetical protein
MACGAPFQIDGDVKRERCRQLLGQIWMQGPEEQKAAADRFARDVLPVIVDIRAGGITTLTGIAAELHDRGIETVRGGRWTARSVKNLLADDRRDAWRLDIVALICILVVTVTSLKACIHACREARREGHAPRAPRALR